MKLIRWIKEWFLKNYKFTEDCKMSHRMLFKRISSQFKTSYVEVTNATNYLVKVDEMERFLALNFSRFRKYELDGYDCEDYSIGLNFLFSQLNPRHACGRVHVYTPNGKHAVNCFIDEFGKFFYIEPQTNQIYKPNEVPQWTPYLIVI